MNAPHKQSGIALIMAITIVSLAAITATAITVINQRQIIRTSNLILRDQAFEFAVSTENFAILALNEDGKDSDFDTINEQWYGYKRLPIDFANLNDDPRFYIEGTLTDLQSRININDINTFPANKATKVKQNTLINLLNILNIKVSSPDILRFSLTDWLDTNDDTINSLGAEQYFYLGLDYPYQTANKDMQHTSTLSQVRGFNEIQNEDMEQLRQELNALPSGSKLNINTATDNVLKSIGLEPSTISTVIASRPYSDVEDFIDDTKSQDELELNSANFTAESEYFLLDITAVMDRARIRINSVIKRDNTTNKSKVISRIIGRY